MSKMSYGGINPLFRKSKLIPYILRAGSTYKDCPIEMTKILKYAFIKKSTIFTQTLRNFVKIRYPWVSYFDKVSLWLDKNCGFSSKSIFLPKPYSQCKYIFFFDFFPEKKKLKFFFQIFEKKIRNTFFGCYFIAFWWTRHKILKKIIFWQNLWFHIIHEIRTLPTSTTPRVTTSISRLHVSLVFGKT